MDPKKRLPLACSFGNRTYEFANLVTDRPIADDVFSRPPNVEATWQRQQKEQAHQEKLRQINSSRK